MFGDAVTTEITANLLQTAGYPPSLTLLMTIFIGIIPLTKIPLAGRPIVSTLEALFGISHPPSHSHPQPQDPSATPPPPPPTPIRALILRPLLRISFIVSLVLISIVFPAFDSIMAFMGSSLCFSICVILPILFHLRIFRDHISPAQWWLDCSLVAISSVLALVGTVWAFLPRSWIGEGPEGVGM